MLLRIIRVKTRDVLLQWIIGSCWKPITSTAMTETRFYHIPCMSLISLTQNEDKPVPHLICGG